MLRTFMVVVVLTGVAHSAFASLNGYDQTTEDAYNQCLDSAARQRMMTTPEAGKEAALNSAIRDCAWQYKPFLKKIDGVTVRKRYEQCLDGAMRQRASIIPPKPKRETLEQIFQDCTTLEFQYLGLSQDDPDKPFLTKEITQHRSQLFNWLKDQPTYYENSIAGSIVLLEATRKTCKNINKSTLDSYLKKTKDLYSWPAALSLDEADFLEIFTYPAEAYEYEIKRKGAKAWCVEAREELEAAGVRDIFLK